MMAGGTTTVKDVDADEEQVVMEEVGEDEEDNDLEFDIPIAGEEEEVTA